MITIETIEKNNDFLDKVALETSLTYFTKKVPTGFKDSMSVARVSYKHALAMLTVRENNLFSLAKESGLIRKQTSDE